MNKENIKIRKVKTNVKGKDIEFDEYYLVDPLTNEEIFDRNIEIENDIRLYDIYKKQMNLLTSYEIKNIRKKYKMNQKEYALALGVGEITIHRFENGSIQTEIADTIMKFSDDADLMYDLLVRNKSNFSDKDFNRLLENVSIFKKLKHHKIASFDINDYINLDFKIEKVDYVTNYLIYEYNSLVDNLSKGFSNRDISLKTEYITPLKLQKLLYYVQGIALRIYSKPAFNSEIFSWQYGPVVKEVYQKYKGNSPISISKNNYKICDGLRKVIELVISSYGCIEAGELIKLTHEEDPLLNSICGEVISIESIKEYFDLVYE